MNRDDARATPVSAADPLARGLALATTLRQLLDDERRAAAVAEPAGLETLAARKRQLIESLEGLRPALGPLLAADSAADAAAREALRACLEECRERNAQNGIVVRTATTHVRTALSMLRETLALDDVTLYDGRGELRVQRERRRFGQA